MDAKRQQQERQHARAVEHVRGGVEVGCLVLGADIGTHGRTGAPALLLMALSSAPLHANNMHVRNWLLIFVAFDENVIVRCGRPSDWKGGSGDLRRVRRERDRPLRLAVRAEGREWGLCRHHYYAVRDVEAGEEL